jgi:hypothetical protein
MSRRIALIYGPETPDGQAVVTSDYVVGVNDAVIAADASSDNPLIVTLPLAATRTLKSEVTVVKIDSSANPVSVIVQGSDTISGVTSVNLLNQWDSLVVEAAGTGRWLRIQSGGGGGATDHGALTGLADDDHTQYALADGTRGLFQGAEPDQFVNASTNFATAGIKPGLVLYVGAGGDTLTLPPSNSYEGQSYLIVAGTGDITVAAASGETINGAASYAISQGNLVAFTAFTGGSWITAQRAGPMFDLPDLATATLNDLVLYGASGPEWVTGLDASQIATGTIATARLGVGTSAGTVAAGNDARLSDERAPKFPRTAWTGAANLDLDGIGGSRFVVQTGTLSAGRDFGLPNGPSDMQTGEEIILQVGAGVSPAKPITVKRNSTDLINGNAGNVVITTAYSWVRFIWTSTGWNYDENSVTPYNGGNFVTATVTNAIAETVPGGAGHGLCSGGASGVVHLHGIYLPRGTTITTITFVSGAQAAVSPTNQWFALCNDARIVLRVTTNDGSTAWNSSTAKPLNLTSTYTTTYSGLYYLACCVTASSLMINFRGANVGSAGGVAQQSFTSTTGLTTPVAEGTQFAAPVNRLSQILGIVS